MIHYKTKTCSKIKLQFLYSFSVCRPSSNTTCNFNGVIDCEYNVCNCKPGYTGDLCQYCDSSRYCLVTNDQVDGEVDLITGEGVTCSCKFDFLSKNVT